MTFHLEYLENGRYYRSGGSGTLDDALDAAARIVPAGTNVGIYSSRGSFRHGEGQLVAVVTADDDVIRDVPDVREPRWWGSMSQTTRETLVRNAGEYLSLREAMELAAEGGSVTASAHWLSVTDGPDGFALSRAEQDWLTVQRLIERHLEAARDPQLSLRSVGDES